MNMKSLRYILLAVVIFAAGFLTGQSLQLQIGQPSNPPAVTKSQRAQAFLSVETAPNKVTFAPIEISSGENLMTATEQFAQKNNLAWETKDYGTLGILVTKIGDKKNGEANSYWQYWVNKKQVQVGADKYQIQPNDVIEWKFTTSQL